MQSNNLSELIRRIPKAELHLHIEGTLEPEMMFRLAKRNNVKLRFGSVAEIESAYRFENLQSFLDLYYEGARVLIEEADFYDLTRAYLERMAAENVRHVEIFFDPQTHTDRGIPFERVVRGIDRALSEARTKYKISSRLIMCFLRHLSAESAMRTLEESLAFKDKIVGVGLDSSERGFPPSLFEKVFARARAEGYRAVAHAGEEGPADYIWQALQLLHAERIDHGVRCLEDPKLVAHLAAKQIPLTVCPLSNVKLCVFKTMRDHNFKKLLDAGLCATINSDDPAYFGGYLVENFAQTQRGLDLSAAEIVLCAENSFRASFLSDDEKARYLAEIKAHATPTN